MACAGTQRLHASATVRFWLVPLFHRQIKAPMRLAAAWVVSGRVVYQHRQRLLSVS
jgi:hypothetical protein